ncbi:asparaginase [Noviherbaspirillum aerium]|uniref:asparaginase n=1 Tax=Noviherbaspirillum aerium TaxID=2588497 RepID=UPI00124D5F49|nr:asparaginase [Noviherbaspirillum aerium]
MSRKHIGVIYTGGTIGMAMTPQGYAPMPDFVSVLSRLLGQHGDMLPRHSLYAYDDPIDSTNATPQDWQRLGRDIAARYGDHDGFVVLHGTDTMAYTASALSFMLQGLRKPVIVTGSQVPLAAPRSDAAQNLITALQLAASDAISEVAICFHGRLLRGNRSTKVSASRMEAFDTPCYPHLAEIGIEPRLNASALLARPARENFQLPDYDDALILPLRFVPGMPMRAVEALLALKPRAVILECYGSGNAPDRDPALLRMLAHASAEGTVLAARSQCLHGEVHIGTYAAGAGMTAAGVVGARDMSFEAVFTKLHHLFALGLTPEEVRGALVRDVCGEVS